MLNEKFVGSNTVFTIEGKGLWRTLEFGATNPAWQSIANDTQTKFLNEAFRDFEIDPFCPAMQGTGSEVGIYLLTDAGLYYCPDAAATTVTEDDWQPKADLTDYHLSCASHSEQLIALYSKGTTGYGEQVDTLTFDEGSDPSYTIPPPDPNGGTFGHVGSGGRTGNCLLNGVDSVGYRRVDMTIDLGAARTVNRISVWYRVVYDGEPPYAIFCEITGYSGLNHTGEVGYVEGQQATTPDVWTQVTFDNLGWNNVRYVQIFSGDPAYDVNNFRVDDIEIESYGLIDSGKSVVRVIIDANTSSPTIGEAKVFGGTGVSSIGVDISDSDSDPVIHAAGQDGRIYEAIGFDGPFNPITPVGNAINGVQIWERRLGGEQADVANDDLDQLHGLVSYATGTPTVQRTQDDYDTTLDFSPQIGSNFYIAPGPYAYGLSGHNPRQAMFVGCLAGTPTERKVFKVEIQDDGPTVYTPRNGLTNPNFNMLTFGPYRSEDVYACGPIPSSIPSGDLKGIAFSDDGGETFTLKNGDLPVRDYLKVLPVPDVAVHWDSPTNHKRVEECQFGFGTTAITNRPIDLQSGTKLLHETDLAVQTPAGSLAFTRSYLQDEHATFDFMGLGWTHNHVYRLRITGAGTTAEVRLGSGGLLKLTQNGTNHFEANPGSAATLDYNATLQEYTLTAHDKSTYVFEVNPDSLPDNWRLKSRAWPTGENWTYHYLGTNLDYVDDGYGRQLRFSYRSGHTEPDTFKNGQLWRIGDHTASNLAGSNPSGRYVELDYLPERDAGIVVNNPKALLASVRDVRGNNWTYDYYGQESTEGNDSSENQYLNYLTEIRSPSVDTTGDGTPDGSLTLQRLTYDRGTQLAVNGDMELDSDWTAITGAAPSINQRSSTQKHGGTYSRRVVATQNGQGIEGNEWSMVVGHTYKISLWIYTNDSVHIRVTAAVGDVTLLGSSQSPFWMPVSFTITPTTNSSGHRLQFIANSSDAEFYIDDVSILEQTDLMQELGIAGQAPALLTKEFLFQPDGTSYSTERVDGKVTIHHFGSGNGAYLGPQNPLGEQSRRVLNRHSRPVLQVDPQGNETVLEWSGDGKNLQRVTDALSNATQFSYDSSDRLTSSTDAEGRHTLYGYSPTSPRQSRLIVALEGTEIALNGDMEADTGWSNISGASPQVNQRSESHVDQANYSRYVSASAVNQGIEGNTWNLIANQLCTITAHVYVVAGQVKMQVPSIAAFDSTTSGSGAWQTLATSYTPSSAQNGLRLQFVANQANTRFYVDSVSISQNTVGELVINGDMETDGSWMDISGQVPQVNIQSPLHADTGQYARYVEAASVNQGIESIAWDLEAEQPYTILARVLVVSGAVKMQVPGVTAFDRTISVIGAWQTLLVSHEPTSAQTNRHLQFVAAQTNTQFYVDSVIVVCGDILQVQEFSYDAKARVLSEKLLSTVDGALLRETVRAYYTSGNGNGLLRSVRQRDLSNNNDLTTTYFYDTFGRVIQTNQSSAFGNCTRSRTLYDAGGNVVASFCNFDLDISGTPSASSGQASATFDEDPTTYWQSTGLTNEWLQYDFGAGNAKALTSITLRARDTQLGEMPSAFTLVGSNDGINWSSPILSVSGEPVWFSREAREYPFNNADTYRYWRLNIQAVSGGSQISLAELDLIPSTYPATVTEALALRASTASSDQNRLTIYEYDELGRRIRTRVNVGTSEEMTTLTVYDALNRVVRTVSNFVTATAPASPYTAAHSAFGHGADNLANTQNLVTDTTYNARGLVESQTDVLGNVVRYVYDDAGRQVKAVQNYVSNGVDPALWIWNNNQWENGSSAAISHGTNNDQNLISTSEYDANGNLVQTRDVLGKMNRTVYDALNRVVKTVRNWQSSGTGYNTDPTTWVWNGDESRWEDAAGQPIPLGSSNDQNLVAQTKYDHMGRVVRTQDETGEWALFGYDPLGRQVRVIRNASDPNYPLVTDPSLSDYPIGGNADQDILTTTVYDVQGRVDYTVDVNGSQTKFVYDGLGRQVKVIQNYIAQGASDPAAWVWDPADQRWERGASDNTAIVHGSNQDQNIIAHTNYDTDGRVRWTQDVLGRKTWHVYDSVGREIKTIVNCTYNETGTTPEDPAYTGSSDSDKDVISQTVYDAFGRVSANIDARGNETRYFYNKLGRRTRTIANYMAQGSSDPATWVWDDTLGQNRWEQSDGTPISHGTNNDENLISVPTYDLAGRVITSRDSSGKVMQQVYDQANRRIRTVANYIAQGTPDPSPWLWDTDDQQWEDGSGNAINHGTDFDLNLISETNYNAAGQVIATRDARGTRTGFVYDDLGRHQQVVQAEGSPLTSKAYTAYDKGGRVARIVRNWQAAATTHNIDPLTWTWNATLQRWEDNGTPVKSVQHGVLNDQNLPMAYTVDKLGRVVGMTNPVGSTTGTVYYKDGRVKSTTDPLGYMTEHRYDGLRRLRRVVQAYLSNGVDPANWIWDATRWEDGSNNAINHTSTNDRNIIADVTLDVAGRQTAIRDPRGNQTTYAYDWLNRRTGLTDPLNNTWATAHTDLAAGQSRVVSTLPSPLSHQTEQNFDRLGRVIGVNYLDESPKLTPDVAFTYDISGNRTLMHEFDGATTIRRTEYSYDAARRLSQVGYDNDGSGTVDQAISYEYDRGGLRTQMTLPGNLTITYTYDQRGQLLGLTDWDNQPTQYAYDAAGRLVNMERPNGLCSTYSYDTASRLKKLRHASKAHVLGHFAYELDARGNRTKAFEALPQRDFGATTISYSDAAVEFYHGTWTSSGGFMQTSDKVAALRVAFFGERADLTLGVGTDHGICDIYLDDTFWGSVDTYAHPTGIITLNLADEGPHLLDIRNRADKNLGSNGYKLRFKQLKTSLVSPLYDLQTVAYTYDALGRLTDADHFRGKNIASNPFLTYGFTYDLAGNRTQEDVSGSYVPRSFTYDAANRLVQVGGIPISYDAAGRALRHLTEEDNNLFYTWDRAGRMTYAEERPSGSSTVLNFIAPRYNGLGQKISQTESPYGVSPGYLTTFLLDPQPGLWKVVSISHDNSPLPEHYIHGPLGIQAYNVPSSPNPLWYYSLQDGLGSVRAKVLNTLGSLAISQRTHYAPYGQLWGEDPAPSPFGFTGEPTEINGLVHLRARYYNPALGVFPSLDPLEGSLMHPSGLNRYAYVNGNPVNFVDPMGLYPPSPEDPCPPGFQVVAAFGTQTKCRHRATGVTLTVGEALNEYAGRTGRMVTGTGQVVGDIPRFRDYVDYMLNGQDSDVYTARTGIGAAAVGGGESHPLIGLGLLAVGVLYTYAWWVNAGRPTVGGRQREAVPPSYEADDLTDFTIDDLSEMLWGGSGDPIGPRTPWGIAAAALVAAVGLGAIASPYIPPKPQTCPQQTPASPSCPFPAPSGFTRSQGLMGDPLVGEIANQIKAKYPATTVCENQLFEQNGVVYAEADIEMQNAIIEVKSGRRFEGHTPMAYQMQRLSLVAGLLTKQVIVYAPSMDLDTGTPPRTRRETFELYGALAVGRGDMNRMEFIELLNPTP